MGLEKLNFCSSVDLSISLGYHAHNPRSPTPGNFSKTRLIVGWGAGGHALDNKRGFGGNGKSVNVRVNFDRCELIVVEGLKYGREIL